MQVYSDFSIIKSVYKDIKKYNHFLKLSTHFLQINNIYDLSNVQLVSLARMVSLKGDNAIMSVKEYKETVHSASNPDHFLKAFVKNGYLDKKLNESDKRSFTFKITEKAINIVSLYCEFLQENQENLIRDLKIIEETDI